MPIPARILRAFVEDLPGGQPIFSTRQLEQRDRIIAVGTALLARYGRAGLNMGTFSIAIRIGQAAIRRYFADFDSLFAEILIRHLRAILDAISKIPPGTPDRQRHMRAAYIAATRAPFGGITDLHALFLRDRHTLPPDLAEPLENFRLTLGQLMATPDEAPILLALLDTPTLSADQIETMLAPPDPAFAPAPGWMQPAARPAATPGRRQKHARRGPHQARAGPPR